VTPLEEGLYSVFEDENEGIKREIEKTPVDGLVTDEL